MRGQQTKKQGVGGEDEPNRHGGGRGRGADQGLGQVERKHAVAVCGHVGGVLLLPQQRILNKKAGGSLDGLDMVADGSCGWPTEPRHVRLAVSGVDICGWRRSTGGVVIPPPRPPPPVALISKG